MHSCDVLVRGSGCVGRALALSLGAQGLRVALLGSAEPTEAQREDVRTYALNAASVALLRDLKVWDSLPPDSVSPVYDMQVCGDGPASKLDFSAWQQGVAELAFIVDASALEQQLAAALRFSPHVQIVDAGVPAALTAGCEGREGRGGSDRSWRAGLNTKVESHHYGQRAIAARLVADMPHQGVARQWFRQPDVLALLPFEKPQPGASYGLVWSLPDERATELMAADPAEFEAALNEASDGAAGRLQLASGRSSWPLSLVRTAPLCGEGWVLLGDAAHVVHPLAGQGLNLGLADVAALARVIRQRETWRELGDERLLRRYARERLAATWAMGELTDGLLRLFASDAPALRGLRNQGLRWLNAAAPLKRFLTARALGT